MNEKSKFVIMHLLNGEPRWSDSPNSDKAPTFDHRIDAEQYIITASLVDEWNSHGKSQITADDFQVVSVGTLVDLFKLKEVREFMKTNETIRRVVASSN